MLAIQNATVIWVLPTTFCSDFLETNVGLLSDGRINRWVLTVLVMHKNGGHFNLLA